MANETAALYADILKVEKPDAGTRLVHARISDESRDLDGQVADYAWLKSALPDWFQWGNVREMHQSNVVGKATDLTSVPDEKAFDGVLRVVDPLTIKKLDEGLYGGVSIGIKSPRVINEKGAAISPHLPGRIVGGKIVEVSLVDHPANENCKLVLAKSATGNRGTLALLAEPEEMIFKDAGVPGEEPVLLSPERVAWFVGEDEDFAKSAVSTKEQRQGAKHKLRDASGKVKFPINDCSDVSDAWHLRGHSSIPRDRVEAYVRRVAHEMGCKLPGDSGKAVQADIAKDMTVPTLTGDESAHNAPIQAAITALKTLISQELAESNPEFDCISWLSGIGQNLIGWVNNEANEYGAAMASPDAAYAAAAELAKATLEDFVELVDEPDIAKRRVFYSREHRTAVEQALHNLTGLLQGDMQGPAGADVSAGDTAEHADEASLTQDGDGRTRTPGAVAQQGPDTEARRSGGPQNAMAPNGVDAVRGQQVSVSDVPTTARAAGVAQSGPNPDVAATAGGGSPASGSGTAAQPVTRNMGTEPDLTKAGSIVEPDAIKALAADAVKAIFPELVKEFREALIDEMKGEFAAKSIEADVDVLGKRARPNFGPHLGEGTRTVDKKFAANQTVNADEAPQEVLDKMVRLAELAKSDQAEVAASAKTLLKRLTEQHFGASA